MGFPTASSIDGEDRRPRKAEQMVVAKCLGNGLVHISKLANHRVNKVEDVVNIGDEILVRVEEIDEKGRVNLTRKGLLPEDQQ